MNSIATLEGDLAKPGRGGRRMPAIPLPDRSFSGTRSAVFSRVVSSGKLLAARRSSVSQACVAGRRCLGLLSSGRQGLEKDLAGLMTPEETQWFTGTCFLWSRDDVHPEAASQFPGEGNCS